MNHTKNLLIWVAQKKFYSCYQDNKPKAIELSRDWLNTECTNRGWTKEVALRASKHVGCRDINEFKKLCMHYSKPKKK